MRHKTAKLRVFVNQKTNETRVLTKSQGKHLGEDWNMAEQIVNEHGERGMRLQLNGATVDILENKTSEVVADGIGNTK